MPKPHWRPPLYPFDLWDHLDVIREISEEQDAFLDSKLKEIDDRFDGLKDVEDEDHREYYSDLWQQEEYRYSATWSAVARRGLFLAVCSSFELHLTHLANAYAAACKSPFRVRDLSDSGIKGCKTLFTKLRLDEPSFIQAAFGSEWETIQTLFEVRNRVAHAGGIVDKGLIKKMIQLPKIFDLKAIERAQLEEEKETAALAAQKKATRDPDERERLAEQMAFVRDLYGTHEVAFRVGGIVSVCEIFAEAVRRINRQLYESAPNHDPA